MRQKASTRVVDWDKLTMRRGVIGVKLGGHRQNRGGGVRGGLNVFLGSVLAFDVV